MKTISKYQTKTIEDHGDTIVRLYGTNIVRHSGINGTTMLDSGGYLTSTTKRRINQVSQTWALGFTVYQKNYQWFVVLPDNNIVKFFDGIVI